MIYCEIADAWVLDAEVCDGCGEHTDDGMHRDFAAEADDYRQEAKYA